MSKLRNNLWIFQIAIIFLLSGCASAKLNISVPPGGAESIQTIALAPNGGVLADAMGLELMKHGFEVYDTSQVSSMLIRMNLNEIEIMDPQNLQKLKNQGVDCLLQVRTVAGYDGRPQSVTIKMVSASTGKILAGATWQNGRAGAQGSPADQDARSDVASAAQQIAEGIAKSVPRR